ncbi:MAG: cupin domain-containing protein [Myxococcales bacterium]|nr:cupin domain-containing protein [Myxococcales bacterium]
MSATVRKGDAFQREALFGGHGTVQVWDLLAGRAAPPFAAALSCELAAGGLVGPHKQDQFPEIVIGLEGQGQARVNGVVQPLNPGDVVHLPLGHVLELRNASQVEPLRYLIIKARA